MSFYTKSSGDSSRPSVGSSRPSVSSSRPSVDSSRPSVESVRLEDDPQKKKKEAIFRAASENDTKLLREFTDASIAAVVSDNSNRSALWVACENGAVDVVNQLLVANKIDPNDQDTNGSTALLIACLNNQLKVVKLLLALDKVDVNKPDNLGCTPFFAACRGGHIEIVALLLESDKANIYQSTHNKTSPFWIACQEGHIAVLKLLLRDPFVDVNQPNDHEHTPLWVACYLGQFDTVKLLFASGRYIDTSRRSEIGSQDHNKTTAAEAAKVRDYGAIEALVKDYERSPPEVRDKHRRQFSEAGSVEFFFLSRSSALT